MHGVFVNGRRRGRLTESLDAPEHAARERADDAASAETAIAVRELREALLRLPEEQRQIVLLVGLEQFSYAEAAEVLSVPIGTVMSRLARGRERLRQLLEEGSPDRHGLRRVK
jgi:RNA polymerase sigma-70 factor (ECF subfamily)